MPMQVGGSVVLKNKTVGTDLEDFTDFPYCSRGELRNDLRCGIPVGDATM